MSATSDELKGLVFQTAPDLHPAWVRAEEALKQAIPSSGPPPTPLERQPVYAQECRDLLASATAPGTRDHYLSQGILRKEFTVPSTVDGFSIPILQLDNANKVGEQEPDVVVIYYHGGGLHVGEADSEELSCRRLVKSCSARVRLYSIGYRLMPKYAASKCVSDALDGFHALRSGHIKTIVVGSSSGGQLAATVAQKAPKDSIYGLLLRCPVTCDPSENKTYLPEWIRPFHTSRDHSFTTYFFQKLNRTIPRDGLGGLPLEASKEDLGGYPRTWIQLCSNDTLYSDGHCLAMALVAAGVEVCVDVWKGWPHTFWLKAPLLQESFDADRSMLEGLGWLLK